MKSSRQAPWSFGLPPKPQGGKEANNVEPDYAKLDCAPYDSKTIEEAAKRLKEISSEHNGSISPETLQKLPAPLSLEGPILREFTLTHDLFPTDTDLSGGYTDVSPYIRALDREVDCYVLWRELPNDQNKNALPADEQPPIRQDELCPVPFIEARDAFKDKWVWILTYSLESGRRTATWRRARADEIKPGDTVMVPIEYGCYSEESGWLGKEGANERPSRWVAIGQDTQDTEGKAARGWKDAQGSFADIDCDVDPERGFGGDPRSTWKRRQRDRMQRDWMTLDDHLSQAQSAAEALVNALCLTFRRPGDAIVEAALWHDLGKALKRGEKLPFQEMLRREGMESPPHPQADVLYAKSKPNAHKDASNPNDQRTDEADRFRHEVASAIAYLMHAASATNSDELKTSLIAYLIMAHHGKVRCMPAPWDDERSKDWNGVRPGDRIEKVQIPQTSFPQTSLEWTRQDALDLSLLLPTPKHPGWQGRVALLLEHYGPFYLAYLEALVRVADWRAS